MTGLDTAIREALDRADARDPEAREHVYRSARQALERGLARRADLDQEMIDQQRERFEEVIREIESEKAAQEKASGAGPAASTPVADEPGGPLAGASESPGAQARDRSPAAASGMTWAPSQATPGFGDEGGGEEDPDMSPAPLPRPERPETSGSREARSSGMFEGLVAEVRAERRPTKKERKKADGKERKLTRKERRARRPRTASRVMSTLFLIVSALVFGALTIWFLNVTGLVGETVTANGGASSFRKFDAVSSGGTPDLMTEDGFGGAWSPIFVPGKSDPIVPGSAARVEKVTDERGKALRLTSTTAQPDGYLRIEVPAALMDRMAGKTSVVALNVRAVDGKPTQIAIECAFSSLGGCSRRRFNVAAEMTDVVLKLGFEKGAPPHKPGYLLLNTDIAGKGRSVDLFAVGLRGGD